MQLHKMDLVSEDQRDAVFKKQVTDRNAKASVLDKRPRGIPRDF
jgi:hypothetical protein